FVLAGGAARTGGSFPAGPEPGARAKPRPVWHVARAPPLVVQTVSGAGLRASRARATGRTGPVSAWVPAPGRWVARGGLGGRFPCRVGPTAAAPAGTAGRWNGHEPPFVHSGVPPLNRGGAGNLSARTGKSGKRVEGQAERR